jgi:hypothetical protein
MKGKLVSGWHLILDRAECRRWMNQRGISTQYVQMPHEYPVLATWYYCEGGTREANYIHPCDVDHMAKELKKATKFLREKQLKKGGSMR